MITIPDDSNLWDWSIPRLEFMIRLGNHMIRWMMSDDPMLKQDEYKPLVGKAKADLTDQVRQMTVVCRAKKMERDALENEFVENVQIGLKPGRLDAKTLR